MIMPDEIKCPHCEDTRREPDYPSEPCHRCRPEPAHLAGLPMGELSDECVQEYFDNPENDHMFGPDE